MDVAAVTHGCNSRESTRPNTASAGGLSLREDMHLAGGHAPATGRNSPLAAARCAGLARISFRRESRRRLPRLKNDAHGGPDGDTETPHPGVPDAGIMGPTSAEKVILGASQLA